jgi:hypothetical protein
MKIEKLHHYTDINTLSLILKNRTIRFNRLDRVDDVTEGESFKKLKLEKFFFVSCWTYDHNETLPQWNMYTPGMAGVRITLPPKMFDYKPIDFPPAINHFKTGDFISPVPFEKIFAKKFFIPPMFLNDEHFGRKVDIVLNMKGKKMKPFILKLNQTVALKEKSLTPPE